MTCNTTKRMYAEVPRVMPRCTQNKTPKHDSIGWKGSTNVEDLNITGNPKKDETTAKKHTV